MKTKDMKFKNKQTGEEALLVSMINIGDEKKPITQFTFLGERGRFHQTAEEMKQWTKM